jgi:hypothetical protein
MTAGHLGCRNKISQAGCLKKLLLVFLEPGKTKIKGKSVRTLVSFLMMPLILLNQGLTFMILSNQLTTLE